MIHLCADASKGTISIIANLVAVVIMVSGLTVFHGSIAAIVMGTGLLLVGAGCLNGVGTNHAHTGRKAR